VFEPGLRFAALLAFVSFVLLFFLPHDCLGEAIKGRGYEGSIEISPKAGFVIKPEGPFSFNLRFCAENCTIPPGAMLEIIPFGHTDWQSRFVIPRISLSCAGIEKRADVVVDPFYSALEAGEQGAPFRFLVRFHDGLEGGDVFRFNYDIPKIYRPYYGLAGLCRPSFQVSLLDKDGNIVHRYPTPVWKVAPVPAKELNILVPSQAQVGEDVTLLVAFSGMDGLPVYDDMGEVRLDLPKDVVGGNASIRIGASDKGRKEIKVRFTGAGFFRITAKSDKGFEATSNPIRVGKEGQYQALWGDLHKHSDYSWDSRNISNNVCLRPQDNLDLARDLALLDFMASTDHGQHDRGFVETKDWRIPQVDMTKDDWERYRADIVAAQRPDIIHFFGYEQRDPRGDTCMIFLDHGRYFIEKGRRLDVSEQWARHRPGELVSIPHFHPLNGIELFDKTSPHETLMEIYSIHGRYEFYRNEQPKVAGRWWHNSHEHNKKGPFVMDLLEKGFRLGLVAAGDHAQPGMWGISGVLAREKTKEAIFEALLARRTYASTGARILVDFRVGGLLMGEEKRVSSNDPVQGKRTIAVELHAPGKIQSVEVIRNGAVLFRKEIALPDWQGEFLDLESLDTISKVRPLNGERSTYYYLRITQEDGHMVWTSPVFFLPDHEPGGKG